MPSEKDLARLPYFAILALGARGARYVEPLFGTWDQASDEQVQALAEAIRSIENLAGSPTAEVRAPLWIAAVDALRLAADAASAADEADAPETALKAADAAAELADAIDPDRPRPAAARAVLKSIQAASHALEHAAAGKAREFMESMDRNLETLQLHASVEGWTDDTGIPVRILHA